jgi:hypothetical protein
MAARVIPRMADAQRARLLGKDDIGHLIDIGRAGAG